MQHEVSQKVATDQASICVTLSPSEVVSSSDVPTRHKSVVSVSHGRRDYLLRRLLAAADLSSVSIALAIAVEFLGDTNQPLSYLVLGLLLLPLWLVIFKLYGLYDSDIKRISHTTLDDLPWLFHALLIGSAVTWTYYWLISPQLSFSQIAGFFLIGFAATLSLRSIVRRIAGRVLGPEQVLFIGDEKNSSLIVRKMQAHPEYGLEPVGFLSDRSREESSQSQLSLSQLGTVEDLEKIAAEHKVERIVVSFDRVKSSDFDLLDIVHRCKELSLKVSILPQMFDLIGPSVEIDNVEGLTVLGINPPVLSRSSFLIKRSLDIAVATVVLVVAFPLLAAIAVAIKLDSRGSVLFTQQRIGKAGRRFKLFKFRTMFKDAEDTHQELLTQSEDPHWLILKDDPRVTRIGRFLRRTSLDELPQFWNVLRGEMSLVGPRPLIELEDRQVVGWARSRLDLTPGISGFWQVLGRNNIPFAEMVKLDYLYVTNWTLWNDIRLIIRTLPAVIKRRGAN